LDGVKWRCRNFTPPQASVDFRHRKDGSIRGEKNVATQGKHESRAECRAIYSRDYRLGAFHDRVENFSDQSIQLSVFAWLAGHQRAFLDIGAGTEYGSAAGEHDGAHILAIVRRIEHTDHFLANRAPQCVDGRPVQRHRRYEVGDLKFQVFELHREYPRLVISCLPQRSVHVKSMQ
jgi:hypothetical protein